MRQVFCGLLVLVFCVSLVFSAETFSVQVGFDWLSAKMNSDGSFESDVSKTALAVAALDSVGYDTILSQEWLKTKLSSDGCYPFGGCDTKVTALSVIALNEVQDDSSFDDILSWYESAQSEANLDCGWYFEVITSLSGNCVASYDLEGTLKEINVPVDAGAFTDCGSSYFLDLDDCLQANLISANPGLEINMDCSDLEGSVVMTLVCKSSSTYYIISNLNSAKGDFVVPNGCYGKTKGSTCDLESTLYSDWAIKYLEGSVSNLVYLKENYDTTDPKKVALMYLVTGEDRYLVDLAELQKSDGSFNRDPYTTGLAVLALKSSGDYLQNVEDAKSYLREEQGVSGDWGSSIEATAMVLYAAFSEDEVTVSGVAEDEDAGEEEDECELDSECETLYGGGYECNYGTCEIITVGCESDDECDSGEDCIDEECVKSQCQVNGKCEYPTWYENAYNCPKDCYCGDLVCDDLELSLSSDYYCANDCVTSADTNGGTIPPTTETSKGGGGWIVFVIIILLLAGLCVGGYLAYKKGYLDSVLQKFKKGGNGGSAQQYSNQNYNPFTNRMPPQQPRKQF